MLHGSVPPTNADGADGDFYIDIAAWHDGRALSKSKAFPPDNAARPTQAGVTVTIATPTAQAGGGGHGSVPAFGNGGVHVRNPYVIPNIGGLYGWLGAKWWQWAFSFPAADIPFFNTGGPVDISAGQSGPVWFLAGANSGLGSPRTGVVPYGKFLFFPMANAINDYPCPPSLNFEPDPGESLEDFLQRTGNDYIPALTDLFATIDGVPLKNLANYRATSDMFTFTADPAAVSFDQCITGTPQKGVAVGYWLLLAPLPPGQHTLHFGAPSWGVPGQDITYVINVQHRHGR
ncbi:MAG: hypothetical protein IT518_20795 [Burkholderiales bacterium]|nr:hypothetical protein [Burkholderiales bacterium]